MIHDLAQVIDHLDAAGALARVQTEVDPVHELAGVAARFEGSDRAVLFEHVRGSDAPVLVGLYWSRAVLADLLRHDQATLSEHISGRIQAWQRSPVEPVVVENSPVREGRAASLAELPVPTHALGDAGPYVDAGVVIARHPRTGTRNASIQRFQVTGPGTMRINIDAGRHLGAYLDAAAGAPLPITVNIGVGPGVHFAAAAPSEAAPIDTDELGIASAFHEAPLRLARGDHSDVELVADAMYALECEILPGVLEDEGPFAEVTGYYATVAPRPVVQVRAIHRRRSPVFHTILSGHEVWNSVGLLGEANVLALLQRQVPGVSAVRFTPGGCGFYHAVVAMTPPRAGWAKQAILATFAAFPPLKMVTVVDDDVDITRAEDVEWAMATRLRPETGIVTVPEAFGHGLNPTFDEYLGTKVGFDCTRPVGGGPRWERARVQDVDLSRYSW